MESMHQVLLVVAALFVCYHLYTRWSDGRAVPNYGQLQLDDSEENRVQVAQPMADHPQVEDLRADDPAEQQAQDRLYNQNKQVLPHPQPSNGYAPYNSSSANHAQLGCFPRDQLSTADLLPREDGRNAWNEVNPQAPGNLSYRNFIEAGHHFGVDTVGQSRGYPNMQLRSDPLIPRKEVGPWNQSTNEPDTNRRHFDIGGC